MSEPLSLLLMGPDDACCKALSTALCRRFEPDYQPEEPVAPGYVSLGDSTNPLLQVEGVLTQLFRVAGGAFPGELMHLSLENACLLLVLPLDVYSSAWTPARLGALLYLCKALGARHLGVFLDIREADFDPTLSHVALDEVTEQLGALGWVVESVPMRCGDAEVLAAVEAPEEEPWFGSVGALVGWAAGELIPPRELPFVLHIEDRFNIMGHRTVVVGQVQAGELEVGESIVLLGEKPLVRRVSGIELFRREMDRAEAGDNVGLLLDHTEFDDVQRGDIATKAPELFRQGPSGRAIVHFRPESRGGYHEPFPADSRFSIYAGTSDCEVSMTPLVEQPWQWDEGLVPGHTLLVQLECHSPIWLRAGASCPIRYKGKGVGICVLLESDAD